MAGISHELHIKRAYEAAAPNDGLRVYIDRLWPRGLTKEAAHIDEWIKTLAPSTELRKWFGHDPEKFAEFKTRYTHELDARAEDVAHLVELCRTQAVTLLFSARDVVHNNAVVLQGYLKKRLGNAE